MLLSAVIKSNLTNIFAHYSSVRIIIWCVPATGILAPLPLQQLGLSPCTLLDTGEAPAPATAVFMEVIEERNILLFFKVHMS